MSKQPFFHHLIISNQQIYFVGLSFFMIIKLFMYRYMRSLSSGIQLIICIDRSVLDLLYPLLVWDACWRLVPYCQPVSPFLSASPFTLPDLSLRARRQYIFSPCCFPPQNSFLSQKRPPSFGSTLCTVLV